MPTDNFVLQQIDIGHLARFLSQWLVLKMWHDLQPKRKEILLHPLDPLGVIVPYHNQCCQCHRRHEYSVPAELPENRDTNLTPA